MHYWLEVPAGGAAIVNLRLTDTEMEEPFGAAFSAVFENRKREADEFYASVVRCETTPDDPLILRQALAGMLWTKQYYYFDLDHGSTNLAATAR